MINIMVATPSVFMSSCGPPEPVGVGEGKLLRPMGVHVYIATISINNTLKFHL